jgi:phosphoesterase RecJ-like protein
MNMHLLDPLFISLKPLLNGTKNIIIQMHINPDGDAVGASLALSQYLHKLGFNNTVVAPNLFPSFLKWMAFSNQIIIGTERPQIVKNLYENADLIFILDFNAIHRAGDLIGGLISTTKAPIVMIDHHLQPELYSNISISTHEVSSTSELIFHLIRANNDLALLDKSIAECLYVGIMTDTGSFSYSSNSPETYHVVADLVSTGINVEVIHQLVYNTYSEKRLRLLGYCINDKLRVFPEFGASYISLSKSELKHFNHKVGDTEGIVNYGLSIDVVCLTALFTEREGRVRISFRSKGNFDVNLFARNHFSGGGHKNASGADSLENLESTIRKFEELLPLYKDQITSSLK